MLGVGLIKNRIIFLISYFSQKKINTIVYNNFLFRFVLIDFSFLGVKIFTSII